MNSLKEWAYVAEIFAVIIPIVGAIYRAFTKINKKQTHFDKELDLVSQRLDFIVDQFGPNGGGLRQAVNEIGDRLGNIEERQIDIGEKVAGLDGKFQQHIVENID